MPRYREVFNQTDLAKPMRLPLSHLRSQNSDSRAVEVLVLAKVLAKVPEQEQD